MIAAAKTGLVSGSLFGGMWVLVLSPAFITFALMGYLFPSIVVAVFLFVLAGFPFGLGMGLFAAQQSRRFLAMQLVPDDEILVHQGGANHFVGLEGVGGWLFLTDRVLRFKSHEINFQPHELAIPLQEISAVFPGRTAWVFPNGLVVESHGGRSERFVVTGRRTWSRAITKAKTSAEQAKEVDNCGTLP